MVFPYLYYLFLIIPLCASCTNKTASESNQPTIEFLSVENGRKAILDESYEPYFDILQPREIQAFTGKKPPFTNIDSVRNFARNEFSAAVTNFNTHEKECLSYVIQRISKLMTINGLSSVANQPWIFIKIEDWLCGGFAHTRGNYIILSQRHIDHYMTNWTANRTPEQERVLLANLGGLLVHEQFHSLQRTHKTKFDTLYSKYWSFAKVDVRSEPFITTNQVSNPDAPTTEWAFRDSNKYYWIRTLLNPRSEEPKMGKDFYALAFELEKHQMGYRVSKTSENTLKSIDLQDFESYYNLFPVDKGLDHPNEISAYMFAEYYRALLENQVPFVEAPPTSENTARNFILWVEKYLS